MKGIFKAKETLDGQFMIGLNDDLYEEIHKKIDTTTIGSYNILPARILGLTYAEFLRYARDKYNGIIIGKEYKYPKVVFNSEQDCNLLCKELLLRWNKM